MCGPSENCYGPHRLGIRLNLMRLIRIAALSGLALIILGYLFSALPNYLASLTDPPGWIIDRPFYQPAGFAMVAGFLVLLGSAVAMAVTFVKAKLSR